MCVCVCVWGGGGGGGSLSIVGDVHANMYRCDNKY